ncbi:low molecular weight protein-tyrosine-phosphatase [Phaeodactylibacter luteus]|uniref:protein-tyrosine-phosphatase n=1 Tax=Phaeodactylibacter luteus TaxID=1564516 RepID=A0A5C6RI13_9BACT|nr:low molecular weight protein-tyrosine-phosphatase [Phaeodactylibacter luteus]TXB61753.1 low molecular weight phosphotyrosine protein phosphatase [Phaeodactylibacter luteus]
MKRVLMVCLGNICRSPLAQGILEAKAASQHLAVEVDSAGTSHWHAGEKPDPRSVYTAAQHGLDISGQRARQFTPNDFRSYDLILAMDQSNYDDILRLAPDETAQKKVKKIMDFVPGAQAGSNVPDPYWDDDGFEKVYEMLDQACEGIIRSVRGEI